MPMLFVLLIGMAFYILAQPGASEGLIMYLRPDFSEVFKPELIISAMGQAFFSLSLGVCVMMTYGAYLSNQENIPKTAGWVTLIDTSVAFLAGRHASRLLHRVESLADLEGADGLEETRA